MKIFATRAGLVYDIIVSSIIYNEEKRSRSKIEIFKTKKKIICSFSFFYFFIKNFFLFNFFLQKKILYLNYKNCNIGIHVLANVYRNVKSYNNIFYYYYNLFTDLYLAGAIVDHAYKISNNIKIAYIDHSGYLNGLYFRVFALKKKIVYTNNIHGNQLKPYLTLATFQSIFLMFLILYNQYILTKDQQLTRENNLPRRSCPPLSFCTLNKRGTLLQMRLNQEGSETLFGGW